MAALTAGEPDPRTGGNPLLEPTGVDGIYGRSGAFEAVAEGVMRSLSRMRPDTAEVMNFPPVMNRGHLERAGYLKSFPHLAATVSALEEADCPVASSAGTAELRTDLALTPAACYPLYPLLAGRGAVPALGVCFDTSCYCFRKEPSTALDRFQAFRMREFVYVGPEAQARAFRDGWIPRVQQFFGSLGLEASLAPSHDPFFGRMAPYLAQSQLEQNLKIELSARIRSDGHLTAIASFNYHADHFGQLWGLSTGSETAHSACVAFGVDRLVLALVRAHGPESAGWPESLRRELGLG